MTPARAALIIPRVGCGCPHRPRTIVSVTFLQEGAVNTAQGRFDAPGVPNIAGRIMTVRGPIDPGRLGITLTHEHVFSDIRKDIQPTYYTPATEIGLWDRKLTLDNLYLARELKPIGESLLYSDEQLAIAEAVHFRDLGGNTIVDVTSKGIRPDPLALRRVSYSTGLNVIMSTGWYHKQYHPVDMDGRTVEDMAGEIIRNITVGVGGTGIRSGIIGEVGSMGTR